MVKKLYGICIILGSYAYCPSYVPRLSASSNSNQAIHKFTFVVPKPQSGATSNQMAAIAKEAAAARVRQSRLSTVREEPVVIPKTATLTKPPVAPKPPVVLKPIQKISPKVAPKPVEEEPIYDNQSTPPVEVPKKITPPPIVQKSVKKPVEQQSTVQKSVISKIPLGAKVIVTQQGQNNAQKNQNAVSLKKLKINKTGNVDKKQVESSSAESVVPISNAQKIGISQVQRQMLQRSLSATKQSIVPRIFKPGDSTKTSEPIAKDTVPIEKQIPTTPPLSGRLPIRGITRPVVPDTQNSKPIIQDDTGKGVTTEISDTTTPVQPTKNVPVIRMGQLGATQSNQQHAMVHKENISNQNTQVYGQKNVQYVSKSGLERSADMHSVQPSIPLSGQNSLPNKNPLVSISTLPKRRTSKEVQNYFKRARMNSEGTLSQEAKIPVALTKDDTGGLN